jgi:glycosyltransferase involved in cell wall biosynthesis
VTCLFDLARREGTGRRSVSEYLRLAPLVLSSGLPIVAFIDPEHVGAVQRIRSELAPGAPTRFISRSFEDLPYHRELSLVTRYLEEGRRSPAALNLKKDTARFHVLTWSKIGLLAEVAADNPFGSTHFWFSDFGLAHVARPNPERSLRDLLIAAAAPLRFELYHEIAPAKVAERARYLATAVEPSVCAALFGGDRPSVAQLATWFDTEVEQCLAVGHPALEEVLLGPVLADHRAGFEVWYGTTEGILENLLEPRTDLWLHFRVLAECRDLGLHQAGLDLAGNLERAWRSGQLELSWREAARLHSDGAAIGWDAGRPEVAARAELRLAELIDRAPSPPKAEDGLSLERDPRRQTVALCMIVRNEAAVIERCLGSVKDLIDTWIIVDTGSSDDTRLRIRSALANLPGMLHERPWHDFGRNRTELLRLARGSADYLLLLDADMTLEQLRGLPQLHADGYYLRHAGSLDYAVPRLVRGDQAWFFVGATHEYLAWDGSRSLEELDALRVVHHADGSSHAIKLERDRTLLEREFAENPDDPRTLFYLARTYAELGDRDRAITLFRWRVEAGGWDEEVFYAQFQLGLLLAQSNWDAGAAALLDAWSLRPARAEPLYELARGWRARGRYDLAFEYASRGHRIPYPADVLFVHREPYEYGLRFERAIAAYHLGDLDTALSDNDALLDGHLPSELQAWVIHNRSLCVRSLGLDETTSAGVKRVQDWSNIPYLGDLVPDVRLTLLSIPTLERWPSTNPSIATSRAGEVRVIVRTVNYALGSDGVSYRLLDRDGVVRTRNYVIDLDPSSLAITDVHPLNTVPGGKVLPGPVVGLEDARLIELRGRWLVSATVRDRNDEWRCEMGITAIDPASDAELLVLRSPSGEQHEKNWMPFEYRGELHFLYSVAPTIVLRCNQHTGQLTPLPTGESPTWASNLRGGSQGLRVADGYIFVVHEVQACAGRRDYLHRLVHFDSQWCLDAASPAFRFLASGTEFCAGIAQVGDDLVLSFGAQDRAAYLARAPLEPLLALLEPLVTTAPSPPDVQARTAVRNSP